MGRAVHGGETVLCAAWSEKTCAALSEGCLDDVLAALRKHEGYVQLAIVARSFSAAFVLFVVLLAVKWYSPVLRSV